MLSPIKPYNYSFRKPNHSPHTFSQTRISNSNSISFSSNKNNKPLVNLLNIKESICNQKINPDVFIIRMCWYRRNNPSWTKKMQEYTLETSNYIKEGVDFETILKNIENKIQALNVNDNFAKRRTSSLGHYVIQEDKRGEEYFDLYKERLSKYRLESLKIQPPEEFPNINTTEIFAGNESIAVQYGHTNTSKSNLEEVQEVYKELINTKNPSIDTILEKVATIRWLFTQEQPYYRGNESVIAVLERAILNYFNVENLPYKKQVSPDFEAFYRNLDEYIRIYPSLFEGQPKFLA